MTQAPSSRPSAETADSRPARIRSRVFPWALAVLVGVVVLDQVTKWAVVEFLGEFARLYLIRNSGAAFSMGEDSTPVFAVIQLLAALLCVFLAFRVRTPWTVAAVGMIGGGAAGNFIDRVFRDPGGLHGHVVDFISIGDFAIFNVADSGITVGVIVYLIYGLFIEPKQQKDGADEADAATEQEEQK